MLLGHTLILQSNLHAIRSYLSLNLYNIPNWLYNLSYPDYQAVTEMKDNESVMVLPEDKYLSPVILNEEWVINETLGMLTTDSCTIVDGSHFCKDSLCKLSDSHKDTTHSSYSLPKCDQIKPDTHKFEMRTCETVQTDYSKYKQNEDP